MQFFTLFHQDSFQNRSRQIQNRHIPVYFSLLLLKTLILFSVRLITFLNGVSKHGGEFTILLRVTEFLLCLRCLFMNNVNWLELQAYLDD